MNLGDILNELAQVEAWLSECAIGHETHDPETCVWAQMQDAISQISGDDDADDAAIITTSLICLLAKTKNPAKAGGLIVDKVRQLCAAMARDRTYEARRKWRSEFMRGATNIDRACNLPN